MKIEVERSGGIGGFAVGRSVDTDELPEHEADRLRGWIRAANFFELPAEIRSLKHGADFYSYRISVEDDGREHSVTVRQDAVPERLKPVIVWMTHSGGAAV